MEMVGRVSSSARLTPVRLRSGIRATMMSIDRGLVRMFATRTTLGVQGMAHRARRIIPEVVGMADIGAAQIVTLTRLRVGGSLAESATESALADMGLRV